MNIPKSTNLVVVKMIANDLAEHSALAYWFSSVCPEKAEYHFDETLRHYKRLKELFEPSEMDEPK